MQPAKAHESQLCSLCVSLQNKIALRCIRRHLTAETWHLLAKEECSMPERRTVERAMRDLKQGKSPSTAAGEFVHEEIEHIRRGKHGARSPQQAIAIGLSKARRAGIPLPPPKKGKAKASIREAAERQYNHSAGEHASPSRRASRAREEVLRKEPQESASTESLSRHARSSAAQRSATERHDAAMKAVKTKGTEGRHVAAKKAAATRHRRKAS